MKGNKKEQARRVLKLIDRIWDKILKREFGYIPNVYNLDNKLYEFMFKIVLRKTLKSVWNLRKLHGDLFCESVVGETIFKYNQLNLN